MITFELRGKGQGKGNLRHTFLHRILTGWALRAPSKVVPRRGSTSDFQPRPVSGTEEGDEGRKERRPPRFQGKTSN